MTVLHWIRRHSQHNHLRFPAAHPTGQMPFPSSALHLWNPIHTASLDPHRCQSGGSSHHPFSSYQKYWQTVWRSLFPPPGNAPSPPLCRWHSHRKRRRQNPHRSPPCLPHCCPRYHCSLHCLSRCTQPGRSKAMQYSPKSLPSVSISYSSSFFLLLLSAFPQFEIPLTCN